ncbi:MAG: tetratricopeptide repeat protein, partial [Gammaproteobacteria bacterium]|nr:tetratricopeptide repeat protein [Gammaproteobacteria bacterium]
IAVLPFDNLSGDPAQEYFSDGITESIILNLSLFPGLNVKSRNSSFAFKQQIKNLGEISQQLDVNYIVEGSVRKTDERIRVTVQLVDATSGNQVWGKRYDAEIEDLFDLEEELSRTIATTVTGQIESDLQRIAIAKGAAHQQSYDLLLQGIYHSKKSTAAGMAIAIEKLSQCLELDAGNALAHATLYACHEMNWIDRWVADFEASRNLCKVHASKALELNPELGQVQVAFAEYLIFNHDYEEAESHLKRALEINPNDSQAIAGQALNLSSQGKFEAALEKARLALQLDPYHTWARWILSEAQFFCGLYEDVLTTIADTGNPPGFIQIYKIAANVKLGNMEAAKSTLKSFLQHCSESMLSMPRTLDEWLHYSRDYAPFADPAFNQEIIDNLLQAGLEEEMAATQQGAEPEVLPSIAVLPFENMSGDPEQEYFSDGITAGIILSLGMFKGLSVKSQRSSFAFKNSVQSSSEIGEALGVDYLVEGSIRKSGDKVRISAQLVEAADGNQVWGRQYNAEAEDVLKLEQELSQTIGATISGRVGHTLQLSALRKPARDLKSYDLYLRGLHHFGKFTPQDLDIAIELFERCIEIDPDNAEAHMQLGMTHEIIGYENWTEDREKSAELSERHLRKAVELAPDNAWVHAYLSERLLYTHDLGQAEYHADKAIELNPNLPEAYAAKTQVTMLDRRYDEALECARLCVQLDPYNSGAAWAAGEAYLLCGEYEKSVKTFRSIETPPNVVRAQIAAALAGMDEMELANKEMQLFLDNARRNMPEFPSSITAWRQLWREYLPFKFDEDSESYVDLLLKAGLCDNMTETSDEIPSIAVLPFENMSGDPEQEHFADGITTDIIATLSKFRRMRTVARYSILQYRDQKTSIADIAAQQKVRYILEGSVRKSGERIRVSAELIDSQ